MKTIEKTEIYKASPEVVFNYLDDLSVTGMHMTQSSMMMMGSKLDLTFLTNDKKGPGTRYRWTGKMMGMKMDFAVEVTKWLPGREKVWETIGKPKLIIYSWYRMQLKLEPSQAGTTATLSITYEKPTGLFYKILCFLFADWYCRWCLKNMLGDCRKLIASKKQQPVENRIE